jgi:type I restriction enzyme M protein
MSEFTKPLETATRKKIDLILVNLGWETDESSPDCNVFTERAKTIEQNKKFKGKAPDYVHYKSDSDTPIAITETKRSGQSLKEALDQAVNLYAIPLGVSIIFVTDGSIVETYDIRTKSSLKLDDQTITEFISEKQVLCFLEHGSQLYSPEKVIYTKRELIKIFSEAEDLLRKEGIREGIERFTEFSNLLFLKLISEIEDDRENTGEQRVLEKMYCWNSFCNLPPDQMLEYINGTILPRLVNKYNHSGDVFQKELLIKSPQTLKKIVDKLSSLKLLDADSDIKGDAFEYFLKNSVSIGTDLGEYFTPRHIVKLIVDFVDPKFGDKIYDPACGTGGFLIEAFRHIKNKCKQTKSNLKILKEKTVFGREISGTAKIAKMNMIIIGDGHNNIRQMDSLKNPLRAGKKYNVVLTNFPFSQTTDFSSYYGFTGDDANPVFLKHIIDALDDGGKAGVVVPEGLLFDEQAEYVKIRKILLQTCKVSAIVKLHNYIFRPFTGQSTSIIFFEKGKPTTDVWFFEVQEDGYKKSSSKKGRLPIKESDLPMLRQIWEDKPISEKSWTASERTISGKNYSLSADDYTPKSKGGGKFDEVELSTLAETKLGKTPGKTDYNNDKRGFKILKYRDIEVTGKIDWSNDDEGWIDLDSGKNGYREVNDGDILLVASGHSSESIGTKAALVEIPKDIPKPVYFVGELLRIRIHNPEKSGVEGIVPNYLINYLLTPQGYKAIQKCVKGMHLTQGRSKKIKIVKPDFDLQMKLMNEIKSYQDTIEKCFLSIDEAKKKQVNLIESFLT